MPTIFMRHSNNWETTRNKFYYSICSYESVSFVLILPFFQLMDYT